MNNNLENNEVGRPRDGIMTVRDFYIYCCEIEHEDAEIRVQLYDDDGVYHSFYLEEENDEIIIYAY